MGKKSIQNPVGSFYETVSNGTLEKSMSQLKPILKKISKDEFECWMTTGELPAVKLTAKELEVLKAGGGLFYDMFYKIGQFFKEHPKHMR